MAIISKLVYSAKLELVLDRIVLKAKYNSNALILTTRLVGSVNV
jgi:hypothetical protein